MFVFFSILHKNISFYNSESSKRDNEKIYKIYLIFDKTETTKGKIFKKYVSKIFSSWIKTYYILIAELKKKWTDYFQTKRVQNF